MAEQTKTTENRLLGALAHASVMTQGLGIIVGVLVYLNQREKSIYVAFQALQAAVYQAIALIVVIVSWIVWTIFYMLTLIPIIQMAETSEEPGPLFWIGLVSMVIPLGLMLILGGYGLLGALRVWQGKDFRYAVVGPWLERSGLWENQTPQAA